MSKPKETKSVLVRILSTLHYQDRSYIPNQLVEFPEADASTLKEHDLVDDEKSAIDYCKKAGVEVVKHEAPAQDEAVESDVSA